jgi:hypothetical protein
MCDERYWKKRLKEAKRELDAAKKRTEVDLAAARYMRVKAELKRLEADGQPA